MMLALLVAVVIVTGVIYVRTASFGRISSNPLGHELACFSWLKDFSNEVQKRLTRTSLRSSAKLRPSVRKIGILAAYF
jgi:hypothetical protein